ncbi:uncharacterized protein (TIGR02444 family) [Skermanella aerolata]|uniref:TIGR02444 family protein n=1 Tax=Skermanella aerolata TaxID=393310 RepID=UPI003D2018F5
MSGMDKGDALWRFALEVYQKPGVSDACLLLQDRYGCNVTLLLFAAWAGAERGVALEAEEMTVAAETVGAWHGEIVEPLRTIRRRLKHGPRPAPDTATGKLRARLQAIEIDAERIELETLAGLLPDRQSDAGFIAAAANPALANLELAAPLAGDTESSDSLRMIANAALSP